MGERVSRIGLIGFGYWGPNLARNVDRHPAAKLVAVCDANEGNLARAVSLYPDIRASGDARMMLDASDIDAVIIATPAGTHAALAETAFARGKHVLVTKPVSTSAESARHLAALADQSGKVLLVDHTFLYTPALEALKQIVSAGDLGIPLYYDSMRSGLGIFKTDADVIDDLAVHDMAIVDHLFDQRPSSVSAVSVSSLKDHLPSLAYVNFSYDSGLHVHIAAHWLSPIKQRKIVIAGDRQMACWDDTLADHTLQVYDSGATKSTQPPIAGRAPLDYRNGTGKAVEFSRQEPLANEIDDFLRCIRVGAQPRSNGHVAARVMRMAEAAGLSARQGGAPINIDW